STRSASIQFGGEQAFEFGGAVSLNVLRNVLSVDHFLISKSASVVTASVSGAGMTIQSGGERLIAVEDGSGDLLLTSAGIATDISLNLAAGPGFGALALSVGTLRLRAN